MSARRYSFGLVLLIVFCLFFAAPLTYAAELKIGYIDLAYVFDNYDKTKDKDKILEQQTKQKTEERQRLVNQIRKMKEEIDLLSEDAKKKKQSEMDDKIRELQEYDQQTKTGLDREREKVVQEIFDEIKTVVDKYATDNSYNFILNNRVLIYSQKQYDLTSDILKILNSKYKK